MKVVVTGATGHLGTYVVAALVRGGHQVVALSRSGDVPRAPFGEPATDESLVGAGILDVASDGSVADLAAHLGPQVGLVHLAAWHPPATAATTPHDRRQLVETNVLGTMRVLEAARVARVSSVIYSSSFEVYGEPPAGGGDIDETARTEPLTDYGATKLAGEHHLAAFAYEDKVRTLSLRMPAIYGPGEHTPRALPNFLARVAMGERPTVFGDGADVRDQLHARDAAAAILLGLQRTDASGVMNVADGAPHTIRELAEIALRVSELGGEPTVRAREKPRRDYHMSIARARTALGFSPAVTLEAGMKEQLSWLRSRVS